MRPITTLSLLTILVATSSLTHAATPVHFFSKRVGGTSADIGRAVAVDAAGNIIVAGTFIGTVDFGGGGLVSLGGADIFLAKYNAAGVHQWSKRFGNTSTDFALSVAVDNSGSIALAGSYSGTIDFGGGALPNAGATDAYVAKFNPAGTHLWSHGYGNTLNDQATGVAFDVTGNVIVTASIIDAVDFGGGPLAGFGGLDFCLLKLNSGGGHVWSQRFGNTLQDQAVDVAVHGSGNISVVGYFEVSINVGGGAMPTAGLADVFVARYDANGVHQWSNAYGGSSVDTPNSIAVDASDNVVIGGTFNGTANFGGTPLVSAGSSDAFVARYTSSTGAHVWSRRGGSVSSAETATGVEVDDNGNAYAVGTFAGTAEFGGNPLISGGSTDIFLVKYGPSGEHRWSHRFGGPLADQGHAMYSGPFDNLFITGGFNSAIDFGGGQLASAGQFDVFVAQFAPNPAEPEINDIADVPNDQGRRVVVPLLASGFDNPSSPTPIVQHEVYFRNDPLALAMAPRLPEIPRISVAALPPGNWVYIGAVPAHGDPSYALFSPTTADSTIVDGQHYSYFFVRGATSSPFTYFDSDIDSGYSVDNLSPSAPTNFALNASSLTWEESSAADFDYFTVYGSSFPVLDVSAVVIDYTTGTAQNVSADPHTFYYLTATDFSGNESGAAAINTLTDVDTPPTFALGMTAYPNPFNPSTTIRFQVPARGRVVLAIYDVNGRFVATLLDQSRDAGQYLTRWDGRDARGRASSSGVYFARLESNGATETRKLVLLK